MVRRRCLSKSQGEAVQHRVPAFLYPSNKKTGVHIQQVTESEYDLRLFLDPILNCKILSEQQMSGFVIILKQTTVNSFSLLPDPRILT